MSVNKFIGIGNLTKDPEVRYMANGDAVANCSIACNEKWKNKAGEKQESVEYINLVFFRRLAEIAGDYLKKGAVIYVEGKLTREKYEKNGVTCYTTKIIVNEMTMLGGKRDSEPQERASTTVQDTFIAPAATSQTKEIKPKTSFGSFDDDNPYF